jgi:hypothetical protein
MTAPQFESLRHAVLEVLAVRHPASFSEDAVRRRLDNEQRLDFQFDAGSLRSALEFLRDKGLVAARTDELGSTHYWAATAAGQLVYERGA